MIMNTILFTYYLYAKKSKYIWVVGHFCLFFFVESCFWITNLQKLTQGGWVKMLIGFIMIAIMYIWLSASKIKTRLTEYTKLDKYIEPLKSLGEDLGVPKYPSHLILMSNAFRANEIGSKVIYYILQKRSKRADIYWFVHVDAIDNPYTIEYKVICNCT